MSKEPSMRWKFQRDRAYMSDPKARFLRKVKRRGDGYGCWLWMGYRDRDGYGRIQSGDSKVSAHRRAYELFVGPLSEEQVVMHRCDNPPCVKPKHLRAGTQAENNEDRDRKGRAWFQKSKSGDVGGDKKKAG